MRRRPDNNRTPRPATKAAPDSGFWHNKGPVLRFGATFALLMAAYYAVAATQTFDQALYRVLRWNAVASAGLLNLVGQGCTVAATSVRSGRFAVNICRGCDAVEPAWFFCAAVLAFPAAWRQKLKGVVLGSLAIGVVNLVRISSLFLVGVYFPGSFQTIHLEVWPAGLIILASLMWVSWIAWVRRPSSDASD